MNTLKIKKHYDVLSPYYKSLWDKHIHHGYYITGKESKSLATKQLINLLVKKAELKKKSKVLDVGCGIGATSIYFSEKFDCDVTGITISTEQVRLAKKAAKRFKNKPKFLVQDANKLMINENFDLIWSVEMISHLNKRSLFFKTISNMINDGGKWCIAAWIKDSFITNKEEEKYIKPIEKGMLVKLPTKEEYFNYFKDNSLELMYYEDISKKVSKTWHISLDIIEKPELWNLARKNGSDFIEFLKSFNAMKKGFKSGCFKYVVMVVSK